jgi:hypothetical protein
MLGNKVLLVDADAQGIVSHADACLAVKLIVIVYWTVFPFESVT